MTVIPSIVLRSATTDGGSARRGYLSADERAKERKKSQMQAASRG
jgi:hypothetical protein